MAAAKKTSRKRAKTKTPQRPAKKTPRKAATPNRAGKTAQRAGTQPANALGPLLAKGSPDKYRVRVRMYRQGLGDCFLITFPRRNQRPFQMLVDCGVLVGTKPFMRQIVEHLRDTVIADARGGTKAQLDVVVATHEHKDHLSGFNQAREVFNNDFEFGAVWMGWTENLTKPEIKKIKSARKKAIAKLQAAVDHPRAAAALASVKPLLAFSQDEDDTGAGSIADALEYLKQRGDNAGGMRYLEPGEGPIGLKGMPGVKVYVLGPPRDPLLLKGSEVTEQMKRDRVVYHLSRTGDVGLEALSAALAQTPTAEDDRYHPFAAEHRITKDVRDPLRPGQTKPNPYFAEIQPFLASTYDRPAERWRRIDDAWFSAFDQLALDLDNDTNNTSLVLAFEFEGSKEVLLFVGDAQVGNWQSWADVKFKIPGRDDPMPAHELLGRTVFYKVGHHCSHNATLRTGGLELMTSDDLVAFIPLDQATAHNQGKKGWDMPAGPLYKALLAKTGKRVVMSDTTENISPEAKKAGVFATNTFIDYFLK